MSVRTKGALVGVFIAGGFVFATAAGQTALAARSTSSALPKASACAALAGMKVESGTVEGAESFSQGQAVVGGETAGATAGANLCRARLLLQPEPGSNIKVEVWLPENWNNKMFGFGGAGFDGGLSPGGAQLLNKVVVQGYAAVQTDVGHKPVPGLEAWVHKQPEKVVDFGYRGNHLAAVVAKQVIAAYYDNPTQRSYFLGCSNGGRDALMAASRYPEDYDGIVAGAPARRYLEVLTQLLWYHQAVHGPGGAPTLESKLGLVHDAIMKKCDRLDGVNDGIVDNPQRCRFDPAELQCKGADAPICLTNAEAGAFRKIYGGPRLSNGERISSGPALGSEGVPNNWTAWVTTPQTAAFGQEFYRWMVFDDPKWNVADFKLDRDYPSGRERIAPIVNVNSADLTAFTRRGGKLIMYQGWDDPIIAPTDTINYYEDVRKRVGSNVDDHVRLFMVPGMGHCAGGPGATSFDMQPELEQWIEQGKAPERVIAIKPDSAEPFSRPLCAWPKTAHYDGAGSSNDAASFNCKAPR
ncbi:tannase/feruloyl esterase family alpha/beta hydrolase [Steroidobacter flavus]|uniref:Tannase/feruloyl esterase family alpha/beta hydrolase n=1 Tax=Steroidobacter flavus TaxID=1842136 RepID=A0ABV8SX22_9GAMM